MPLPGGESAKVGARFEAWWTLRALAQLIEGSIESLQIEELGLEKSEFTVVAKGARQFHQTKHARARGTWTLAALEVEGLLKAIFDYLSDPAAEFWFVSGTEGQELKELSNRAREAKDEASFLELVNSKVWNGHLATLKQRWGNPSEAECWQRLRRTHMHVTDEMGIKERVFDKLRLHYFEPSEQVANHLRGLAEQAIRRELRRGDVVTYLEKCGCNMRRLRRPEDAVEIIKSNTCEWLTTNKRRLIGGNLIRRDRVSELAVEISNASEPSVAVVMGRAGYGKTGCIVQLVEDLIEAGHPVLALRLDRLPVTRSVRELAAALSFEESPPLLLMAAAATIGKGAVLVLDQLDAVSLVSGRSVEFLEVIAEIGQRKSCHLIAEAGPCGAGLPLIRLGE